METGHRYTFAQTLGTQDMGVSPDVSCGLGEVTGFVLGGKRTGW